MKKLLLLTLLALHPAVQALQIDVRPKVFEADVEVIGMHLAATGQEALVLTGKAADSVARAAGCAFDESKQMIILTGKEVDQVVGRTLTDTATVGKDVIIETGTLIDDALRLTVEAVRAGTYAVSTAAEFTADVAGKVLRGLGWVMEHPLTLISDAGIFVVDTGKTILKDAFHFIGDLGRLIGRL